MKIGQHETLSAIFRVRYRLTLIKSVTRIFLSFDCLCYHALLKNSYIALLNCPISNAVPVVAGSNYRPVKDFRFASLCCCCVFTTKTLFVIKFSFFLQCYIFSVLIKQQEFVTDFKAIKMYTNHLNGFNEYVHYVQNT